MSEQTNEAIKERKFVLPVGQAGAFYSEELRETIQSVVVPYQHAKPGDIIAIDTSWRLHGDGFLPMPVDRFIVMSEDGSGKGLPFTSLPEQKWAEIAIAAMLIQSRGLCAKAVTRIGDHMDYLRLSEPLYFSLYLLHDLILFQQDDPVGSVFEGEYYDDDLDQDQINVALKLLIPEENVSNHKFVQMEPSLRGAVDFINKTYPIPGDEEDEKVILELPRFSSIGSAFEPFNP